MSEGCFNLRIFESNVASKSVDKHSGETFILGIIWDLDNDVLKCCTNFDSLTCEVKITKRLVLSTVQKVFDPIGMLAPSTLLPKLLLQEIWKMKKAWDQELPQNIVNKFMKWFNEIQILKDGTVPRCMKIDIFTELHVFVDASKGSYAGCVFARSIVDSRVSVIRVRAKSRVAPLKLLSIPRLEVMACCVGARLVNSILKALNMLDLKVTLWSDSTTALWWIKEYGNWSVFVANRTYYLPDVESLKFVTFIDNDNILRVKSKITERNDESSFLYPILLPDKCEFTKLLIRSIDKKNCHAGIQIMQSLIRERFWIIKARKTIKSILNECFICARFKVKSLSSGPSPLPPDRVNDCAIFEVVGIDLAGPLFLKTGEKVWITLFTCAVYRALHLELVNALSSDAFLLALRRFIARRGRPRIIDCDNGTNFRGAFNDLAKLDWHKISRETSTQKIVWKFIPPTAAWWGGWWERKEYLSGLIQKQNDNRVREPRIGEMVLIGNDNKKRLSRPIAKIIELIPGRDGEIRTVRLKTLHGTVIRPVQRIFPLEVQAIANSDKELKEESISVKKGLGIRDDPVLHERDQAIEIFKETVEFEKGRYIVQLPFRKSYNELSDNYPLAKQRFQNLWRRFGHDSELYQQYREIIRDYTEQGIIEEIECNSLCSDIKQAFLQICLADEHKDAVRFLWSDDEPCAHKKPKLQVYRFNRVKFGGCSRTFLLAATIRHHIEKYKHEFPDTVELLDRNFYVDDLISGGNEFEEALQTSRRAKNIMEAAGMNLRKWITNDANLMEQWKKENFNVHPVHETVSLGANGT
ncbi:integrase catalytic domain-containing protein [Trichonephila clavipes]|nr:integrase catalytic domain-containing protein [Trichonephila clavipes]